MLYCPQDINVIYLFIPVRLSSRRRSHAEAYGEQIFGDFYFLLIYIPYGK